MRSFGVVVFPPLLDLDLGFSQTEEDFTVQELIPEPGVEAFAISVLPGRVWFDAGNLATDLAVESVTESRSAMALSLSDR